MKDKVALEEAPEELAQDEQPVEAKKIKKFKSIKTNTSLTIVF